MSIDFDWFLHLMMELVLWPVSAYCTVLTGGEAGPLVAAGELDVEVGDQGVDVVVPLHLQAERGGEAQVLQLHSVDVHLLEKHRREHVIPQVDWAPA